MIHNESYLAVDICSGGTCTVTPPISLNFHTNHHWCVRGKNTGGWGEWSEKVFFDYLDTPPGAVTPGNPTDKPELPRESPLAGTRPEHRWLG